MPGSTGSSFPPQGRPADLGWGEPGTPCKEFAFHPFYVGMDWVPSYLPPRCSVLGLGTGTEDTPHPGVPGRSLEGGQRACSVPEQEKTAFVAGCCFREQKRIRKDPSTFPPLAPGQAAGAKGALADSCPVS